jgi:hypothetical protein
MANDTVEIKITGDSSDLAAAMQDVANRLELLHQALAGTAGKFTEVGKDAEKGMGKVKKSTEGAEKAVKGLKEQLKDAGAKLGFTQKNLEAVADRAGRADSAMSAFATVLDNVSPQLAENARLAADMAGGIEQMILAITQAPKVVLPLGIALGALAVAYELLDKPARKVIENNEKLGKAHDDLGKQIEKQARRMNAYRNELSVMIGVEKDYELVFRDRLALLMADEKADQRKSKRILKQSLAMAKTVEEEENAIQAHHRRLKVSKDAADAEFDLITQLRDRAKAEDEVTRAIEAGQLAMVRQVDVTLMANKGLSTYKSFVTEMNQFERAADGSTESLEKMTSGLILSDDAAEKLANTFAVQEQQQGKVSFSTKLNTDQNKRFTESISELNKINRERTGIEQDVFKVAANGQNVFGAINRLTGEGLSLYQVYNLVLQENLLLRQQEIAQEKERAARVKAFVDERDRLLKSLKEENDAIEARLSGPFSELLNAHELEMSNLDEIIEKYEQSAKRSRKSAEVVSEAEQQKALKTIEYKQSVDELISSLTEATDAEARLFVEAETSLQNLTDVSTGRIESEYDHALSLLEDRMEEQKRLVEDYYRAAKEAGDVDVEAERLRKEELLEIEAEFQQNKQALDQETSDKNRQVNEDTASAYAQSLGMMSEATFKAMELIAEQSDTMSETQKRRMFQISQLAAMGEIAINGVVALSQIYREYGITPAGIALGIAQGAVTAAQIAEVGAMQPSFDIGGVIKGGVMTSMPDQVGINALPGESVLNRSATAALGEEGVNALNAGKGMGQEVIVVPAYRHFDRFIKDEYRKGGSFRKMMNNNRQYPVGHRRR